LRRPEFIARQAAHPRGLLGRLLFRLMAAETVAVNERTLELLAPEPSNRILEIGFGHGRTYAAQRSWRTKDSWQGSTFPRIWFGTSRTVAA
jgi:hypothetical protein